MHLNLKNKEFLIYEAAASEIEVLIENKFPKLLSIECWVLEMQRHRDLLEKCLVLL